MENGERFEVVDEQTAEWCLEKIEENEQERRKVEEQYKKMVARYDEWRDKRNRALDADNAHFKSLLLPWVTEQTQGKKKSVALPSGTVKFSRPQPNFEYCGEPASASNPALISYLERDIYTAAHYIKEETVKKALWAKYKKTLTIDASGRVINDDGEIIEGMTAETPLPELKVELKGGANAESGSIVGIV